jgi:probable rRNA maturation factor
MMEKQKLSLSVQYADSRLKDILPRWRLRRWVQSALEMPAQITLRFVDATEGQELNSTYRGKDYATNVLTFPYEDDFTPDGSQNTQQTAYADIVLCTDVLEKEAAEQEKTVIEHAAHLVVHGTLHAQGYDHIDNTEAEEMEALETKILGRLGFKDPYQVVD